MDKPTIDLDKLLIKLQTLHEVKSEHPELYPEQERMENLNAIAKLSMMIEVFHTVRGEHPDIAITQK